MQPELVHDPTGVKLLLLLPLEDHKRQLRLVPDEPRLDLDVVVLAATPPETATSSSTSAMRARAGGVPGSEEVHVLLNARIQKSVTCNSSNT